MSEDPRLLARQQRQRQMQSVQKIAQRTILPAALFPSTRVALPQSDPVASSGDTTQTLQMAPYGDHESHGTQHHNVDSLQASVVPPSDGKNDIKESSEGGEDLSDVEPLDVIEDTVDEVDVVVDEHRSDGVAADIAAPQSPVSPIRKESPALLDTVDAQHISLPSQDSVALSQSLVTPVSSAASERSLTLPAVSPQPPVSPASPKSPPSAKTPTSPKASISPQSPRQFITNTSSPSPVESPEKQPERQPQQRQQEPKQPQVQPKISQRLRSAHSNARNVPVATISLSDLAGDGPDFSQPPEILSLNRWSQQQQTQDTPLDIVLRDARVRRDVPPQQTTQLSTSSTDMDMPLSSIQKTESGDSDGLQSSVLLPSEPTGTPLNFSDIKDGSAQPEQPPALPQKRSQTNMERQGGSPERIRQLSRSELDQRDRERARAMSEQFARQKLMQQQRFAEEEQRRQEIEARIKRLMEESKLAVARALGGAGRSPPKRLQSQPVLAPPDRPRAGSPMQPPPARSGPRPAVKRFQSASPRVNPLTSLKRAEHTPRASQSKPLPIPVVRTASAKARTPTTQPAQRRASPQKRASDSPRPSLFNQKQRDPQRPTFSSAPEVVQPSPTVVSLLRTNQPIRQWEETPPAPVARDSASAEPVREPSPVHDFVSAIAPSVPTAPSVPVSDRDERGQQTPTPPARAQISLAALAKSLEEADAAAQARADRLQAAANERSDEEAVQFVHAGQMLLKHIKHGRGRPHKRHFVMFATGIIGWSVKPKGKLRTERVHDVKPGPSTGVQRRRPPNDDELARTFTFVTDISSEVCCIAPTAEDAARWIQGVGVIVRRFHEADNLISTLSAAENQVEE